MKTTPLRLHFAQILPIVLVALIPALALIYAGEYLLFHTLAELFVAAVALVVFSIAWHTRKITANDYLTLVGMASLPFALVIMIHALAYKGMPTFPWHDTDLPTQLWLIARVLQAASLLLAPWYLTRRLRRPGIALAVFSAISGLAVVSAIAGVFPAAFIEGSGLTPFKVWTEYAVILAMVGAAAGVWAGRRHLDPYVRFMLWTAMALIAVAEVSFTLYTDPFGIWNRVGHVLHVAAFVAIYAALVRSSLEEPLSTLFLRLKQREEDLAIAYKDEHDIAETLQSAMTVQPSQVPGLDLAHRYLPASGIGRIGGDFYDLFRLEGPLVAFVIGDVCGKGLKAAATTFQVRSVVRAYALTDPDPTQVLESVNQYLLAELQDDAFVTAIYGTIDTVTGAVRYAIAGHPDPVLCGSARVDGASQKAPPLGVFAPLDAPTHAITMAPGDGLVLVTDGVIEAPGPDERFGTERFELLLHATGCSDGADALLDRLLDEVREFSGSTENDDDIAMVAIRFAPVSPRGSASAS